MALSRLERVNKFLFVAGMADRLRVDGLSEIRLHLQKDEPNAVMIALVEAEEALASLARACRLESDESR